MIFGDRISESPRVPSPWTAVSEGGGLERRSISRNHEAHAPNDASSRSSRSSRSSSAAQTPPLRAVAQRRKAALATGRGTSPGRHIIATGSGARGEARGDDNSDSASTPPTDDSDQDGFFCLDVDLDLGKMALSNAGHSPDTSLMNAAASAEAELAAHAPLSRLAPEPDVRGNLEYKLRILPHTRHRYDRLLTQLKWRMLQGGGQCTYEVGVLDDGGCIGICALEMESSLRVLANIADELDATVSIHRAFEVEDGAGQDGSELQMVPLSSRRVQELLLSADGPLPATCGCGVSSKHLHDMLSFLPPAQMDKIEVNLGPEHSATSMPRATQGQAQVDATAPAGQITISSVSVQSVSLVSEEGQAHEKMFVASILTDDAELDDSDLIDEDGITFSLSLDEQATRLGMGYQRKAREPRRRCRYNVRSAQQRQRTALEDAKGAVAAAAVAPNTVVVSTPLQTSIPSVIVEQDDTGACQQAGTRSSVTTSGQTQASGTLSDNNDDPPPLPCKRLILEVSISRSLGHDAFIDYASL